MWHPASWYVECVLMATHRPCLRQCIATKFQNAATILGWFSRCIHRLFSSQDVEFEVKEKYCQILSLPIKKMFWWSYTNKKTMVWLFKVEMLNSHPGDILIKNIFFLHYDAVKKLFLFYLIGRSQVSTLHIDKTLKRKKIKWLIYFPDSHIVIYCDCVLSELNNVNNSSLFDHKISLPSIGENIAKFINIFNQVTISLIYLYYVIIWRYFRVVKNKYFNMDIKYIIILIFMYDICWAFE